MTYLEKIVDHLKTKATGETKAYGTQLVSQLKQSPDSRMIKEEIIDLILNNVDEFRLFNQHLLDQGDKGDQVQVLNYFGAQYGLGPSENFFDVEKKAEMVQILKKYDQVFAYAWLSNVLESR